MMKHVAEYLIHLGINLEIILWIIFLSLTFRLMLLLWKFLVPAHSRTTPSQKTHVMAVLSKQNESWLLSDYEDLDRNKTCISRRFSIINKGEKSCMVTRPYRKPDTSALDEPNGYATTKYSYKLKSQVLIFVTDKQVIESAESGIKKTNFLSEDDSEWLFNSIVSAFIKERGYDCPGQPYRIDDIDLIRRITKEKRFSTINLSTGSPIGIEFTILSATKY